MSAVATNRLHGSTAATEILVLEPIAQRMGLVPILLTPGEITIGSSPESQVQLTSLGVHPQHCVIESARSRVSVRALDRRTWLNNLPVSEGWLRAGDRLAVGPVEFRVRQAEPWDILPEPVKAAESPVAEVARVVSRLQSEQEQVKSFETQLLRQIADLETEVARHQAAVNRLERRASDEPVRVANPVVPPAVPVDIVPDRSLPVADPTFTAPRFFLSPTVTSELDEEHRRLYEELESHHRQARKQLAELSVRNELLNRQCLELAAQWEQLRQLIAEQEAATVERTQREQQLYERERRCTFQESEIARRSQRLSEELDKVAARLLQLQAEADQVAGQSSLLTEREQSLIERSRRLDDREAEIEQSALTLEQRDAACRESTEAAETWHKLREETEARWTQRDKEAELRTSQQQTHAEALKQREEACEQLAKEIRHDRELTLQRQQNLAERSRSLDAREAEIEKSARALEQREIACRDATAAAEAWQQLRDETETRWAQRDKELESQKGVQQAQSEVLTHREEACDQLAKEIRHDRQLLAADRSHLEKWNEELQQLQTALTQQQDELDTLRRDLEQRESELKLRDAEVADLMTNTQQQREHLTAEQTRLETWNAELTQSQTVFDEQQEELAAEASKLKSEAQEFVLREYAWEQIVSTTQRDQERIVAEQDRLEALRSDFVARQSELTERQLELDERAASIETEAEQLTQRNLSVGEATAAIQEEKERLIAESQRLETWSGVLSGRQAKIVAQEQEIANLSANWSSQIEELRQRKQTWEQTVAATEQAEEQLLAERYRLEAAHDDLMAQQAAVAKAQGELQARQKDWEETRRSEADASSSALTSDYSQIERQREELALAEQELERVEGELGDWEAELHAREEDLETRESALNHAETECAWRQLESERNGTQRLPLPDDTSADDAKNTLARLSEERDELASELFLSNQPVAATVEDNIVDHAAEVLRRQSEELARDVEQCREQWRLLSQERLAIDTGREELQRQVSHWQTERSVLESNLEAARSQMTDEKAALDVEREELRARESQVQSQLDELTAQQATANQLADEIRQRRDELDQQARDLEQRSQELSAWHAEQSREAESHESTRFALERDLSEARDALQAEQENLRTALGKFHRERQAWEEERLAWDEQLAAQGMPESSDTASSNVMDVLSRLDDMVQTELDRDAPTDLTADSSDPFEAIRAQYGVSRSEFDREELAEEVEPEVHGTPRSLWDADTQDDVASESNDTPDLPTTEEDLTASSLRARLAEMFSMELSESKPARDQEVDESPLTYDGQPVESMDSLELESDPDRYEPASTQYQYQEPEPEPEPESTTVEYANEPVADEYDSVESYMQRLLDRNRKSRGDDEPAPARHVSQSTARPRPKPAVSPTVSEFDDSVPEETEPVEVVPDPRPAPVPREPVDRLKMRAGLDSLRQVANISARHAIARSKWKKMRTAVAMQGLLVATAGVVGMSIVTGKWLGMSGTDLWGWVALIIAAGLGVKVYLDLRGIKHGERRTQRARDEAVDLAEEASSLESVASAATDVPASSEPGDEALAP